MKRMAMFLAFFVYIGIQFSMAQTVQITGTVTSSDDKQPLIGATVKVKGTTAGVLTDANGKFSITLPSADQTIEISYVGYKTQEFQTAGRNVIDVSLQPTSIGLQEVVVTALGITRNQKALGYSVANVNSDEISKSNQSSVMNSLEGKLAGVTVSSGGGLPGASTKVILRGYSSVEGNNNPLYVVDGVPIDNTDRSANGVDFGNGANDINPDDIESISILKGAAATALYGSRAANGLIMITTKKGKMGEKIKVTVTSKTTFSNPLRLPEFQNEFGQGWNGISDLTQNGSWGPAFNGKVRPWGFVVNNSQQIKPYVALPTNLEDFYNTGLALDNSISLSGGGEKTSFYLSYNNVNDKGMLPANVDYNDRNSFAVRGEAKGKNIKFSASVNYINIKGKNPPDGTGNSNAANLYSDLLQIPRDISIVDLANYQTNIFNNSDNFFTPYAYNPYYSLNQIVSSFNENRFFGSFSIDYQILKGLKATLRAGSDITDYQREDYEAILAFSPGSPSDLAAKKGDLGYYYTYKSTIIESNSDLMLNYNKNILENLNLNVVGGYNIHERTENDLANSVNSLDIPGYYNIQNSSSTPTINPYIEDRRLFGVYGTADLSYKEFLFLTLSGRRDWSSTLPVDNDHFDTYGLNLSFVLTDAVPTLKNNIFTFGKFRANVGTAGNDAPPYSIKSVFVPTSGITSIPIPYSTTGMTFPIQGVNSFRIGDKIGNAKLQPELSKDYELGTDLRFLEDRLKFDLTYYHRNTTGEILPVSIATSSGYSTQVMNIGTVQNKGWEITIGATPIKTENWKWDINYTYSKNRSMVVDLSPTLPEVVLQQAYDIELDVIKGSPLGVIKGPVPERDPQGHIVVSPSTGFPLAAADKQIYGSVEPNYVAGITSNLSYKGFNFGFVIDIRQGGLMYSGTADLMNFTGNAVRTLYNNRQPFIVPNSVAGVQDPISGKWTYSENTTPITFASVTDYFYFTKSTTEERNDVISKSYTKLREVTLSYDLPKKIVTKLHLNDIEVGLYGRNLLIWTPAGNNFIDPEVTSYGNDLAGELGEFRTNPTARQLGFNVKLKF